MRNIGFLIFIFFVLVSSGAGKELQCQQEVNVSEDFVFKGLLSRSDELSKALCKVHIYDTRKTPDYSVAYIEAIKWRDTALDEINSLKKAGIDLKPLINAMYENINKKGTPGTIIINKTKKPYSYYWNVNDNFHGVIESDEENTKCKNVTLDSNKTCVEVLEDFRVAVSAANADTNRINLARVSDKIGLYSKQWDKYFSDSRSQTPLELYLNTSLYKDELSSDKFVLPPSYQVVLLHPSIVFEYISNATDGDQEKEALAIEWVGINWWEKAPWWDIEVPLGISFVSTYSDRASVDDWGIGLMFHINNDYSIGFTKRDRDTSIFFTIDLWKLFQGKQQRFEYYKDKVETYHLGD